MAEAGSITLLLRDLGDGDERILSSLHKRCWQWTVQTARKRLKQTSLRAVDEEDVAQEAFLGFVASVRAGRAVKLNSRHDLFAFLTHIIACKAATQIEHQLAAKRGGGLTRGESALDARTDGSMTAGFQAIADNEQTPSEVAALADCYEHYLTALPESLRLFAELHVAGATNAEIANQLGCVARTVERKLALIRDRWQEMAASELAK